MTRPRNGETAAGRPSLLGFTQSAFDPASRVRFIQFIPALEAAGWRVTHRPNRPDRQWRSPLANRPFRAVHQRAARAAMKMNRLRDLRDAGGFDAVFVNRDLAGPGTGLYERLLLTRSRRVVFDFDDAIQLGRSASIVSWLCRHAAWVTPGNEYLAEYASRYNANVTVLPTVIDTDRYVRRTAYESDRVRVGWSGSDQSIAATLFPYLPMLRAAQAALGFDLVIVSNTRPDLPISGLDWRFVPWTPELEARLGELMDIGIMPLADDPFQRGKCGMKLLQYMAAGLPTIASPVGVNRTIIMHGHTGLLAGTEAEWHAALAALVESTPLRARFGNEGRRRCEASYSLARWAPELLRILERVRRGFRPEPLQPPVQAGMSLSDVT